MKRNVRHVCLGLVLGLTVTYTTEAANAHQRAVEQARMLDVVAADFRHTAYLTGIKTMSPGVEAAMRAVPRHLFVPPRARDDAYDNRPLSIGHGQTISQPFIVALMTELAAPAPGRRILEIGTGSGYQAAVLAAAGAEVYSVEIITALAEQAREQLAAAGYEVHTRIGDGNLGWPEAAPFDAILVTAGGRLPPALLEQLAPEGRLVIPINNNHGDQDLVLLTRAADGSTSRRNVLPVRFVPLVRGTTANSPND